MAHDQVDEYALDPAAFADDAPVPDFFDPKVAARLRRKLIESAERDAAHWGEIRRRSMELARQLHIP